MYILASGEIDSWPEAVLSQLTTPQLYKAYRVGRNNCFMISVARVNNDLGYCSCRLLSLVCRLQPRDTVCVEAPDSLGYR